MVVTTPDVSKFLPPSLSKQETSGGRRVDEVDVDASVNENVTSVVDVVVVMEVDVVVEEVVEVTVDEVAHTTGTFEQAPSTHPSLHSISLESGTLSMQRQRIRRLLFMQ